jgi:two-component system nitrogen regulation response regulator GlnG
MAVWIIDDDKAIRWVLEKALARSSIAFESFSSADDALAALSESAPQVMICDIRMPGMDGLKFLSRVKVSHPSLPVIIMTAHADLDSAVSAFQGGAFEYLPKPFDIDQALELIERALTETSQSAPVSQQQEQLPALLGQAPAMQDVFRAIGRLSQSTVTVLITGESGTGKERVAEALHQHSTRASRPFIALNTAAIPKDLLESELFGHEKGAFTGAQATRRGRFEEAEGGTLFLDEIGDMPLDVQTRLLRVLADGQFYRVGGHQSIQVDVRIIAATHQDLEKRVADGVFREDLFHRLNVIRIHLPSLKERQEDIPKLAAHFLMRAARELNVEAKVLNTETESYIKRLPWPGNVRQLENVCRWLTVMASGQEVLVSDLPPELLNPVEEQVALGKEPVTMRWQDQLQQWIAQKLARGDVDILAEALPEFERIMLNTALQHTHGHKQEAARLLGWGRNTLTRKLKELDMH